MVEKQKQAESIEAEAENPVAPEPVKVDISLIGKPVEELTPAELGALASQLSSLTEAIDIRRNSIQDKVKAEEDVKLAAAAKAYAQALGHAKLPKLQLLPNADSTEYTVSYVVTKKKGNGGKRATSDVNTGAVTINKIGVAMGGIMGFRNPDGNEFETLKELIVGDEPNGKPGLKQADGTPEADRCWDISKKGISASDIMIKYHDGVVIIFNDGTEKTVKQAVEEMKAARAAA